MTKTEDLVGEYTSSSKKKLNLRARTNTGLVRIQTLHSESTLDELKIAISEQLAPTATTAATNTSLIRLLKGYPPKLLEHDSNGKTSLSYNQIKDGEMLTVQLISSSTTIMANSKTKSVSANPTLTSTKSKLLRKTVPANNSCLFTSIHFVMSGGELDLSKQCELRDLIAVAVQTGDRAFFSEALLDGKSNSAYCAWIRESTSWGGSVECLILSRHYRTEICVVDIRTCRVERFGEDCSYSTRVLLIYDGIHFDPLFLETTTTTVKNGIGNNRKRVTTKFSTEVNKDDFDGSGEQILVQAIGLAEEAKKSKQFTDVANFALRCLTCQEPLKGQTEAQAHAKRTGHINFGEF